MGVGNENKGTMLSLHPHNLNFLRNGLNICCQNLKVQQEKRQTFTGGSSNRSPKTGSSQCTDYWLKSNYFVPCTVELLKPRSIAYRYGFLYFLSPFLMCCSSGNGLNGTHGNDEVVINMNGMQQQQQSLLGVHESYIASRAEAVESIEQTIVELQVSFTSFVFPFSFFLLFFAW